MNNNLQERIKYLETENSLLRKINRKNCKIIKKLLSQNKYLKLGLIPKDFENTQLTIYDLL